MCGCQRMRSHTVCAPQTALNGCARAAVDPLSQLCVLQQAAATTGVDAQSTCSTSSLPHPQPFNKCFSCGAKRMANTLKSDTMELMTSDGSCAGDCFMFRVVDSSTS